jgi:hypothetical protein
MWMRLLDESKIIGFDFLRFVLNLWQKIACLSSLKWFLCRAKKYTLARGLFECYVLMREEVDGLLGDGKIISLKNVNG